MHMTIMFCRHESWLAGVDEQRSLQYTLQVLYHVNNDEIDGDYFFTTTTNNILYWMTH